MTKYWLRTIGLTLALVGAWVGWPGTCAVAQTPPAACALDSLYLLSPEADGVTVTLSTGERFGAVVQWLAPPPDQATCAVLVDTAGLGCDVVLEGDYLDHVDRILRFATTNGGVVGDTLESGPYFTWVNMNQERTGRVVGAINLGNDGGVFVLRDGNAWDRANDGLPPYLSHVDVLALAGTPAREGRLLAYLEDHQARGLWLRPSLEEPWRRLAPELFRDGVPLVEAVTAVAISPVDPQTLVVGTVDRGVFVSHDGGETFTQHRDDLDGDGDWTRRRVSVIAWPSADRLVVGIDELGVFVSADGGDTFTPWVHLDVPQEFPYSPLSVPPHLLSFHEAGDGTLLAGVASFALYRSLDGGETWNRIWRDQDPENPIPVDATAVITDPVDASEIWMGTSSQGIWHTDDGGTSWEPAAVAGVADPGALSIAAIALDVAGNRYVAVTGGGTLLTCPVGSVAWSADLPGPGIDQLVALVPGSGDSRLWLATRGGGIYVPGTLIRISDTIVPSQTEERYLDLDLGLSLVFGRGEIRVPAAGDEASFSVKAQDFQGYAVWRSQTADPHAMELVGLYDKNNPETCIEGYCGDPSIFIEPGCFHEKRAACFQFSSDGDTVRFFDPDIYDGFVYYYAVTTFDYGNIALVNPQSLTAELIFSPRFAGDTLTPFPGPANFTMLRAFRETLVDDPAEEIYVVPNPLRLDSPGMSTSNADGEEIQFKNLPPGSRVQVFTLDGDLVADLGPELQEGASISWITRNEDGELLASGVYIYRVQRPGQEDFYSKFVILR